MPESKEPDMWTALVAAFRGAKVCPTHECIHDGCTTKYPVGLHLSAVSRSLECDKCAMNVVEAVLETAKTFLILIIPAFVLM